MVGEMMRYDIPEWATLNFWYGQSPIKFNIVKYLYRREFAMLVPSWAWGENKENMKFNTRMLKCHNVQGFDFLFKALRVFEHGYPFNLYYSLAQYINGIPNQTMNLRNRNNDDWKKNHFKEMLGYDFLIDVDANSHDEIYYAQSSANIIRKILDKYSVPYHLRFSGKGFHFVVPHEHVPFMSQSRDPSDKDNIYRPLCGVAKVLRDNFSELVDTGIYDSRRLCKIPYSLSVYQDGIYVCYPFNTLSEFRKMELVDMMPSSFDVSKLRNRGETLFNPDGNMEKFIKFIDLLRDEVTYK